MSITIPSLIEKKRDGLLLSSSEIKRFVDAVTDGSIEESQIGAMLMAIYLNGLEDSEAVDLTRCMTYSGQTLHFPEEWTPDLVDKHSTGGVGDKISLILAPALAALGFKVPMVSGRGLAFTGGTLDKLESIPGFKTQLNNDEMTQALNKAGCFIAGAGSALAPADGILYKQRDITSTVGCIPLIVSSILSKKVAEGTKALVMDVKVGAGSFMKTEADAIELAEKLVSISSGLGVKTTAVLSRMDNPIGKTIGNALEVNEALQCLQGKGPSDVINLVSILGGVLLLNKGKVATLTDGEKMINETLQSGRALQNFQRMLVEQGVSEEFADGYCRNDSNFMLEQAPYKTNIKAHKAGYISNLDALKLATCSWHLGAGRSNADDPIDHRVGLELLKVVDDKVDDGTVWVVAHHSTELLPVELYEQLQESITIMDYCIEHPPAIIQIIS